MRWSADLRSAVRAPRWGETFGVVSVWTLAIAFIRPYGEFPLIDDWDFTIATWNFARTGHFHFTPFTAVSLRAQVLWGAIRSPAPSAPQAVADTLQPVAGAEVA